MMKTKRFGFLVMLLGLLGATTSPMAATDAAHCDIKQTECRRSIIIENLQLGRGILFGLDSQIPLSISEQLSFLGAKQALFFGNPALAQHYQTNLNLALDQLFKDPGFSAQAAAVLKKLQGEGFY